MALVHVDRLVELLRVVRECVLRLPWTSLRRMSGSCRRPIVFMEVQVSAVDRGEPWEAFRLSETVLHFTSAAAGRHPCFSTARRCRTRPLACRVRRGADLPDKEPGRAVTQNSKSCGRPLGKIDLVRQQDDVVAKGFSRLEGDGAELLG